MKKELEEITFSREKETVGLLEVWEQSVRVTHDFLQETDIQHLRPIVKEGFLQVERLFCIRDLQGMPEAFIGTEKDKVEMLFVHPRSRGKGLGKKLLAYAVRNLGCIALDVNEQNLQAIGFYEYLGFKVIGRSETDAQGMPFPLLHMKLTQRERSFRSF